MSLKQAVISSKLTVTESVSGNVPFADANTRTILDNGMDETFTLTPTSSPAGTLDAAFQQALTAGAATIDLTAMTGPNGAINGTGLKVRAVKFRNPTTNSNEITIAQGASNGYGLLGATWSITLLPGQSTGPFYLADGAPVIGSGAKNIDISGTGVQSLDVILVIG